MCLDSKSVESGGIHSSCIEGRLTRFNIEALNGDVRNAPRARRIPAWCTASTIFNTDSLAVGIGKIKGSC